MKEETKYGYFYFYSLSKIKSRFLVMASYFLDSFDTVPIWNKNEPSATKITLKSKTLTAGFVNVKNQKNGKFSFYSVIFTNEEKLYFFQVFKCY